MERIKEAVKLAKLQRGTAAPQSVLPQTAVAQVAAHMAAHGQAEAQADVHQTDPTVLDTNRVIAAKSGSPQVASFDMLRTKVLQEMDRRGWQVLVVTSPTPACGKTVTSINLALSIARQAERYVFLVDLDLRKPRIAQYLGVKPRHDLVEVVSGSASLADAIFQIDIANSQLAIIGNKKPSSSPTEAIVSRQMTEIINELRSYTPKPVIIVDMPPVLGSDDVLAFLPQADCCVLAVAEGISTLREIESSEKLLANTNVLGCVLTKSTERLMAYY
jgi:protein-tyrosine kinase